MTDTEASTMPVFKKKSRGKERVVQVRKRSASPIQPTATEHQIGSTSTLDSTSSVVQKKKKLESNPLRQGTIGSLASKRFKQNGQDSEEEDGGRGDRFGETGVSSYSKSTGTTKAMNTGKDDATKVTDWDLQVGDGNKGKGKAKEEVGTNDDGIYRGQSSYSKFQKEGEKKPEKYQTKGPIKASAHIREITLVDYQPDVCKDYKETGYCGFGDTCKFLHDRSDYLAGWQLSADPNSKANSRSKGIMDSDDEEEDDEDDEDIPFACLICRQPFTNPVVTKCGHYFCESCAIKRFNKNPKCFACGEQTNGLFNSANKILEKMEKKKKDKEDERLERKRFRGDDEEKEEDEEEEMIEGVEIGGASENEEED